MIPIWLLIFFQISWLKPPTSSMGTTTVGPGCCTSPQLRGRDGTRVVPRAVWCTTATTGTTGTPSTWWKETWRPVEGESWVWPYGRTLERCWNLAENHQLGNVREAIGWEKSLEDCRIKLNVGIWLSLGEAELFLLNQIGMKTSSPNAGTLKKLRWLLLFIVALMRYNGTSSIHMQVLGHDTCTYFCWSPWWKIDTRSPCST